MVVRKGKGGEGRGGEGRGGVESGGSPGIVCSSKCKE